MSFGSPPEVASPLVRVGYMLSPGKIETFIQPSLLAYAADHGVDLVAIDPHAPIDTQGPFHCILHKLRSPDWISQLLHFISLNPNLPVVDPPHFIEPLHNRISMLEVVNRISLSNPSLSQTLGIPSQVVVEDSGKLSDSETLLGSTGLEFPLIAKSVSAHGSSDSHEMSLVFKADGLGNLKTPVVLQQFVNHGGLIFKVYVAGRHVKCVKRKSLPDVSDEELRGSKSILTFSQISNLSKKDPECSDAIKELMETAELPPMEFVMDVARGMRKALGLRLFNFDMIRDSRDGNRYLIIDINYFPGYAKVPGYEKMLTEFLLDVLNHKEDEEVEENGGNN